MKRRASLRWRTATVSLGAAICVLALARHGVMCRSVAQGAGGERVIESLNARDVHNVFATGGVKSEGRPARIFVIRKGTAGGAIEGFDSARNDKLRIEGFGLTNPAAAKALMREEGSSVILPLPGGPKVKLLNSSIAAVSDASLQLELDRCNLRESFSDDFSSFSWYSEGLSPKDDGKGIWRTNYGWGPPTSEASRSLPGQSQVYADPAFRGTAQDTFGITPFHLVNGTLEIWAEPAPQRIRPFIWGRLYTSGIITTKFSFSQLYGVFEIRARMPAGRGFWPAFWLLPSDGGWPPEIDVFEILGHDTATLYTTAHSQATGTHTAEGSEVPIPDSSSGFHCYAVEWQKDEIRWYFDGVEVARKPAPEDMHKPMYMLANLGVGGSWPGEPVSSTRFPGIFAIDFIRAYRRDPIASTGLAAGGCALQDSSATDYR